MNRFSKLIFVLIVCFMISISLPMSVFAQGGPGDPCVDPQDYCPIDGGLSALLAVGVGYGIKKVNDARKSRQSEAHS